MLNSKFTKWVRAVIFCLAGTLASGWVAAANYPAAAPNKLDNATCQTCHESHKPKIKVPGADDEDRELYAVDTDKYAKSAHAKMDCVSCHTDIVDSKANHKKVADGPKPPECAQCHLDLWKKAKKENKTAEKPRLGVVADNVEAYKNSFHARENKDEPGKPNAICSDCHNVHTFDVPVRGSKERKEWHLSISDTCGNKCHEDQLEEWAETVHGVEAIEKNNLKTAVCTDCHTSHDILNSSSTKAKLDITAYCGDCHLDYKNSYKESYHGKVNTLGYPYTAKCFDCHGSHKILKSDDPESSAHTSKRLKTCQTCHSGKKDIPLATQGFVTFYAHANSHDFEKYPAIWIATKAMVGMLFAVFAFFWGHSILWYRRENAERKAGKTVTHIRTADLPTEYATKHVRRFTPAWIIMHLVFAISLMVLAFTGLGISYPEAGWAKAIMSALGSPKAAAWLHRVSAYTMITIFILHLIGLVVNLWRNRKTFKFFGPDSLVPNWKDLDDMIGMFKWFFGKGPRPQVERWAYWEKFDYWAVFWGIAVIGGSGLILAWPHVVANFLPGWVFNMAAIIHGEEAILATVFLFTVHFFNNHFRPDKLPPPDIVMFTGTQSLEEFRHEHPAQYQRLIESGELKNYLVEAPSKPFTLASKILGLVLIACGIGLVLLIPIGLLSR